MVGVWARGDIISGGATVISAMGEGKKAAGDMDQWLRKDRKWSEKKHNLFNILDIHLGIVITCRQE